MDANELTSMRNDILALLPDTCNILSVTRTSNGMGGFTSTWGTAAAGVQCRLDALRGRAVVAGGEIDEFFSYTLTVPYNTAVTGGNRIEHSGVTYSVTAVDTGKSWAVTKRLILERE